MAKQVTSFRFDEEMIAGIDNFAAFLGVPRARLVEDAIKAAVATYQVAVRSVNASWDEIRSRYGDDAQLTMKLNPDETVELLINGEEPADVQAHLSIEPDTGIAHVFLEVSGWERAEYGTVRVGPAVLLAMPLAESARLPWPPDPERPLGFVARLGDIVPGRTPGEAVPSTPLENSEHVKA